MVAKGPSLERAQHERGLAAVPNKDNKSEQILTRTVPKLRERLAKSLVAWQIGLLALDGAVLDVLATGTRQSTALGAARTTRVGRLVCRHCLERVERRVGNP
jgi:hypothetical protein